MLTSASPGSKVGSRRNYRVESKIELNLLEGLLLRKKNLDRHSRLVSIFLKFDFFKMADFCDGPLVSGKSKIPNILLGDKNGRILAGANYES